MTKAGKKIRVLIVDDSAFMRKVLHGIISADPQMEVVGEARDGKDAVNQAQALKPDVITMDINMPHVDGLQATEIIMSQNPRAILVVSSESRDGADPTLKALELGAIDFVAKPSSGVDLDMKNVSDELYRKLRLAAKVKVVRTAVRTKLGQEIASAAPRTEPGGYSAPVTPPPAPGKSNARFPIVIMAASTGGPAALMKLIPQFPRDFQAAVLLIQHMPGNFTRQFSKQLAEICPMRVKEAEAGEILAAGTLYVCPGTHHLRITATGRVTLDDGPRVEGYRPSADITMETAAEYAGVLSVGVILSGMGSDGAKGAKAIKAAGGHVIAQDEATSVIFGMNAEAIKVGAADQVVPLEGVFTAIEKRVLYIYGAAKVGAL